MRVVSPGDEVLPADAQLQLVNPAFENLITLVVISSVAGGNISLSNVESHFIRIHTYLVHKAFIYGKMLVCCIFAASVQAAVIFQISRKIFFKL